MIDPRLANVALELDKLGIRFVVVGGLALGMKYPVETEDVDILVALEDYPRVLEQLAQHERIRVLPGGRWGDGQHGVSGRDLNSAATYSPHPAVQS